MEERKEDIAQNTDTAKAQKTEKKKLTFSPVQQKVIDLRGKNMLVCASAGAGKTAVLVERLCQLVIKDKIPVSSILAVTFTEDAAAEMKARLKARLMEEEDSDWVRRQLTLLETASISTIHSFCLDLVRQYYYLAGLTYSRANTVETGMKASQVLEDAYRRSRASLDSQQAARLILYLEAGGKTEQDLQSYIMKFLEIAASKPDPKEWMTRCANEPSRWSAWFFEWFRFRVQILKEIMETVLSRVEDMSFAKIRSQEEYITLFSNKIDALDVCLKDLDDREYERFGHDFIEYLEQTAKFSPTINKESFRTLCDRSRDLEKEIMAHLYSKQEYDAMEQSALPLKQTFVELALAVQKEFARGKEEAGFIDFSDMEHYAWQLLGEPAIQQALKEKYEVILVDEYQDTNDLQENILHSFARANNYFRVGDIKQSIYGFRQARPDIMKDALDHPGEMDETLFMQENYRSSASVIEFNNAFYKILMNTPGMDGQFDDSDVAFPGTEGQKEGEQVPVRFLYSCYADWHDPDSEKQSLIKARSRFKKNRCDMIAQDISKRVAAGEFSYRDVCILSRSSTAHDQLKEALEAWGIKAIHRARKGFYTNKAVQIVLSALKVIADRRDDISLMALLCSPLGGCTQRDVLSMSSGRETGQSLYTALRMSDKGTRALEVVRELEQWKDLPLASILSNIYNCRSFYLFSTTSQDKTNLDLLMEKAVQAQKTMDLDAFLSSTVLEENLDKTSEAIPFGKEEDAVRISTIHASKGLQYKVVYILCEETNRDMDASSPIALDSDLGVAMLGMAPDYSWKADSASRIAFDHKRFIEDQQEKMRLLYVATTRAEKELVFVDAIKDESEYEGGMDLSAIYENKGFTSWVFHAMYENPQGLIRFDRKTELLDRPNVGIAGARRPYLSMYEKPVQRMENLTASLAKKSAFWPDLEQLGKRRSLGKERGTLIHEAASTLSYPYQAGELLEKAEKAGIALDENDVSQFVALNDNEQYAGWMKQRHEFECPYSVLDGGQLVHGYMDLVAYDNDIIDVVDFKTDKLPGPGSFTSRYSAQLQTYQKAMRRIHPGKTIRPWIYSFFLQEMIPVPDAPEEEQAASAQKQK